MLCTLTCMVTEITLVKYIFSQFTLVRLTYSHFEYSSSTLLT